MRDVFSAYHPAVQFLYFTLVTVCSMCFLHPLCLAISLACAVGWSIYLKGRRALRFALVFLLPTMLMTALVNPAFSHAGVTVLGYFPTGNPLTLESILYGLAAAVLLVTVMCWFSCYNEVMTSDKFIYLFGKVIPSLSLMLSMCLRFVPKCKAQLKTVAAAQTCVGRDVFSGKPWVRVGHAVGILSIMVTWALENAIETADSMKSRAYGLPGRSSFSIYRFERRDKLALGAVVGLGGCILAAALAGGFACRYFPKYQIAPWSIWSALGFLAYLLLCALPLVIDLWEEYRWKKYAAAIGAEGEVMQ